MLFYFWLTACWRLPEPVALPLRIPNQTVNYTGRTGKLQQRLRFDRLRAREQTPPILLLLSINSLTCNTLLHGISLTILRAYIHAYNIHTYICTCMYIHTYIYVPRGLYTLPTSALCSTYDSYPSVETYFFAIHPPEAINLQSRTGWVTITTRVPTHSMGYCFLHSGASAAHRPFRIRQYAKKQPSSILLSCIIHGQPSHHQDLTEQRTPPQYSSLSVFRRCRKNMSSLGLVLWIWAQLTNVEPALFWRDR